jgi:hypothetical protein
MLLVPTCLGVLKPSGNGHYLLGHKIVHGRLPSVDVPYVLTIDIAMTLQCDLILWHRRFGHCQMQSLHTQQFSMTMDRRCLIKPFLAIHTY